MWRNEFVRNGGMKGQNEIKAQGELAGRQKPETEGLKEYAVCYIILCDETEAKTEDGIYQAHHTTPLHSTSPLASYFTP